MYLKRDDERLMYFARMMVTILYFKRSDPPGQFHEAVASGFVMQVGEDFWLCTAGHVIHDLREWKKAGRLSHIDLAVAWLDKDGVGTYIPLAVIPDDWTLIGTGDYKPDLGAIRLHANTVKLFESGPLHIVPESYWPRLPIAFDHYYLLGSPAEIVDSVDKNGRLPHSPSVGRSLIHTEKTDRPLYQAEKNFDRFYGVMNSHSVPQEPGINLNRIEGVSGGPILGCRKCAGGMENWIVAVQSHWNPDRMTIVADYAITLYNYLRELTG